MADTSELLKLAKEKFGELTEAEERLFRDTANGQIVDYSIGDENVDNPTEADGWSDERVLRASRIAWLCTDKQALQFVTHRGLQIKGIRIDEEFNLQHANVQFPLAFLHSAIPLGISLQHAHILTLNLEGTQTGPIMADGLNVKGDLFLRKGFKAKDRVRLRGAIIGGSLFCKDGHIGDAIDGDRTAFDAEGLKVERNISLDSSEAYGEVCLFGATIGGTLDCEKGQFINPHGKAINADGIKVNGNVWFRYGFKAKGEVGLRGAIIGGDLDCTNAQFTRKGCIALSADKLRVDGGVYLRNGFKAEGEVRLAGATIGRDLTCSKGQFINMDGKALVADGLKVDGDIFLRDGFTAEGEVSLQGATLNGCLECQNGKFISVGGKALNSNGLKVKGYIALRDGFKAEGEVNLLGATIVGNLECQDGQFINESGNAISADGLTVGGHVYLRNGFRAHGTVSFPASTIDRYFFLTKVDSPAQMRLDLRSAKIGTIYDDRIESWPEPGQLVLHGLVYDEISSESPRDSKTRIEWLRLQDSFWPQPYEQLAKVLRKSGDDAGAKDVLIAKNKDKAKRRKLTWPQWLWYRLLGPRIGYGHNPWLALRSVLVFVLVGWFLFAVGYSFGLITPPNKSAYTTEEQLSVLDPGDPRLRISTAYPVFNSLVYSIDVFIPVVDFHQAKHWLPNANRGDRIMKIGPWPLHTGGVLLFWLWLETILGWILSTLFIVSLTGLVRT